MERIPKSRPIALQSTTSHQPRLCKCSLSLVSEQYVPRDVVSQFFYRNTPRSSHYEKHMPVTFQRVFEGGEAARTAINDEALSCHHIGMWSGQKADHSGDIFWSLLDDQILLVKFLK